MTVQEMSEAVCVPINRIESFVMTERYFIVRFEDLVAASMKINWVAMSCSPVVA